MTSGGGGDDRQRRRTALSITAAAEATGTSRTTIRRRLDAGELPGAYRIDGDGAWRIPVEDLLAAGLTLARPAEDGPQDDPRVGRVAELERLLDVERARRQAAEELAAERAERIGDLRVVLRALEAGAPPTPAAQVPPAPAAPETRRDDAERRPWWRRRRGQT